MSSSAAVLQMSSIEMYFVLLEGAIQLDAEAAEDCRLLSSPLTAIHNDTYRDHFDARMPPSEDKPHSTVRRSASKFEGFVVMTMMCRC